MVCKGIFVAMFVIVGACILIYASRSFANPQIIRDTKALLGVNEDAIAVLKDKSGEYYQVRYQTSISHGRAHSGYTVQDIKGGKILLLGGGGYDGLDGTCGQGKRKQLLNLDKTVSGPIDFKIEDLNKDKYLDVYTQFEEEDCKTGKKSVITNIFYATESGFQLDQAGK